MRLDQELGIEEQRPVKQSFCGSLRRDTHWKCLILTCLIYGCLAAISWCRLSRITKVIKDFYDESVIQTSQSGPCDEGYVYIPVAFVVMLYLVYLVECWHCHTRIELQYKIDVTSVHELVQYMREAIPIIWWKAICYHYVRRTRQVTRYRNGDAFTTTQVYYERVNSHTAGCALNFSRCGYKDISKILRGLEEYPATKIKFTKGFSFATVEAESEFEDQRSQFFQEHERRDDYMETREGMDLLNVNFKEYLIAFADPDNLPWYVSHAIFWVASILLLSWPLRVLIEYKTAYLHYHVHKLFGTNYLDPAYIPGQMSRVSTMCSTDFELNVRNNYSIVPSYSEALLMDCAHPDRIEDSNGNLVGTANGHLIANSQMTNGVSGQNGYISNGHVQNGLIQGGRVALFIQNGAVTYSSRGDQIDIQGDTIQKRKKKHRRKGRRRNRSRDRESSDSSHRYGPNQQSSATSPETPEDQILQCHIIPSGSSHGSIRIITSESMAVASSSSTTLDRTIVPSGSTDITHPPGEAAILPVGELPTPDSLQSEDNIQTPDSIASIESVQVPKSVASLDVHTSCSCSGQTPDSIQSGNVETPTSIQAPDGMEMERTCDSPASTSSAYVPPPISAGEPPPPYEAALSMERPPGSPARSSTMGSPARRSPSMGSPVHRSPSVGSPVRRSPSMGSPARRSPSMSSPSRSVSMGSPARGSPAFGSPSRSARGSQSSRSSPGLASSRGSPVRRPSLKFSSQLYCMETSL
ncbi:uncharacterized protein LOC135484041 isoform X2 [Lineus longissimus]|uniref:uncharacterized protein LOC135484041 isoform X2 n=1 Tax=Lineus longissimus TaxID=88925 RepID=UPI00315D9546